METSRIQAYLFVFWVWILCQGSAQPNGPAGNDEQGDGGQGPALAMSFHSSVAVTIVVLTTMFTLTFLLLLYAKHCKIVASRNGRGAGGSHGSPNRTRPSFSAGNLSRKDSGVERSVIDALPVFKFASLQGLKEGLECAVCLSRFEGSEVLRLLPKCRHAFHVDCVDTWLESHSTCPLCRHRVEPQDVLLVYRHDENVEAAKGGIDDRAPQLLQISVQREELEKAGAAGVAESGSSGFRVENKQQYPSARLSEAAGSIGCFGSGRKEGVLLSEADEELQKLQFARRFAHRIVVSNVMSQHRWSDRKPSDLLFLSSQMITTESGRMAFAETKSSRTTTETNRPGGENSHSSAEIDPCLRSMSEITGFARFQSRSTRNSATLLPVTSSNAGDEQKWFSIAGKTLQWLAGKGNGAGSETDKFLH